MYIVGQPRRLPGQTQRLPYNSDAREEVRQRQSVNERKQRGGMLERCYPLATC